MWIYNDRFPECGIKEFTIKNEEYIINKDGTDRRLYAIETD